MNHESPPLLDVRDLSKTFAVGGAFNRQHLKAVNRVSFELGRGQVRALVGESGSGKSTILRVLARLEPPSEGRILFEGRDILAQEPRGASLSYRSQVQMIFQDPFGSLNPTRTVGYHIERPLLRHRKATRANVADAIANLLETVGLAPGADYARQHPHELSGGQRQRVAIARALAVEPRLVLADEPTSMLDVSIRMGILNLLKTLQLERSIGFVYVTHDLASARYFADETMVMYAGHVVESAESDELVRSPAHPYTKLLMAAVPRPTRRMSAEALPTTNSPARMGEPPLGCPFSPRCSEATEVCRTRMPDTHRLSETHRVRCHLYPG